MWLLQRCERARNWRLLFIDVITTMTRKGAEGEIPRLWSEKFIDVKCYHFTPVRLSFRVLGPRITPEVKGGKGVPNRIFIVVDRATSTPWKGLEGDIFRHWRSYYNGKKGWRREDFPSLKQKRQGGENLPFIATSGFPFIFGSSIVPNVKVCVRGPKSYLSGR